MEIHIGRSGRHCNKCEAAFVHEQPLTSRVRLLDGAFLREDFCRKCWDDSLALATYSVWESNFYDPQVAEQQPEESFSPLRQTFYEAVESADRPSLAIAYLAAQLLRRQKVFRLIKETTDPDTESAVWLFSDRIGNRLIEVKDPNLSHADLEQGRITLVERLNALENPEVPIEESIEGEENSATTGAEIDHGTLEQTSA